MKKILLILIVLLMTGCMDYDELNDIGVVTMMEISYNNKHYDVTLEILNTNKDVEESSYFINGTGRTFEEAINDCKSHSYLKPNFSHMYVAILDKNIINNKLKNYNDKKNFISNYAQIYLRKNFFEKEIMKNRIIYNKSLTGLTKLKK